MRSRAFPGAWPATLVDGEVTVRTLRWRDLPAWVEARERNVAWLREWEATPPGSGPSVPAGASTFVAMMRQMRREARAGRTLPFAVVVGGAFAGQLNIGGIVRGSLHSAHLGYWIDERYAGRGVMPTAVALATDYCFDVLALHRVEVNIRPENAASRRVVDKVGFREEGLRRAFLHIAGDWRDHLSYALVRGEVGGAVPGSVVARWHARQSLSDTPVDVRDRGGRRG